MLRILFVLAVGSALTLSAHLCAAEFVVDQKNTAAKDDNPGTAAAPFKTINKAASVARAGDTVTVKAGLYREYIELLQNGAAAAPIVFRADPPGSVVVSGADLVTNWEPLAGSEGLYSTPWNALFFMEKDDKGQPIEFHPASAPLWGRAEQVLVDGKQLKPCPNLDDLRKARAEYVSASDKGESPVLKTPMPRLGGPFNGMFTVDTRKEKKLYLWLADGGDPRQHPVELAVRERVIGSTHAIEYVQVHGFVFKNAATFSQRPAVALYGKNNLLENCIVEEMSGAGAYVEGTVRHCVIRNNGNCGGGAIGSNFVNEETLWEGNSWKPIDRNWEAAGMKSCRMDGGVYQRCVFRRNGGPGLWFDIHARNILVTECAFVENEGSGLFIEISRNVRVVHNLVLRNAVAAVGIIDPGSWSSGGIHLGESMNCFVGWNTCVGNRDGITFREQGPRVEVTPDYGDVPYRNTGDVVVSNICADNANFQLGFWSDNFYFGPHPNEKDLYKDEEAWQQHVKTIPRALLYKPQDMGLIIDRNLYAKTGKPVELLFGVPWRPRHQVFNDPAALAKVSGFDARSRVGDPQFENAAKDNFRPTRTGLAWEMQAGWLTAPTDLDQWMNGFLPAFR
jgi:hypothetical protein